MFFFFFFKQKTAYEMRISDWSSDVCSSDLIASPTGRRRVRCSHIEMIVRKETREHFRIAAIFVSTPRATQIALVLGLVAAGLRCIEHAGESLHASTRGARQFARQTEAAVDRRSEEHTSELQSLMSISYADYCLTTKQTYVTQN